MRAVNGIAITTGRPGLQISVLEGHPEFLVRELRSRRIEIVVGRLAFAEGDRDLDKEMLYDEQMAVIARRGHPLHDQRRLSLRGLRGQSWILPPPDTAFYRQLAQSFEMAGVDVPPHSVRTLSTPVTLGLVARTDAIAVVPRSILTLGSASSEVQALRVKLPQATGPVGFVRLTEASASPAMLAFMDCCRTVVADILADWDHKKA